jgi:hypothetical protein
MPMEQPQADFLQGVVGILDRLHATTQTRGQATLSMLIDLAKTEAEDALRQAGIEADMRARLQQTSSIGAWK